MAREPKIDRVKYKGEDGKYFRDTPEADFLVFDRGLKSEPPLNYETYTDFSKIDTLVVKVGTSIITHRDYRRMAYNMKCLAEDLTGLRRGGLNVLLVTSGAIGLGRKARLSKGERIPEKDKSTPEQRRLDAIEGQFLLFTLWKHHFYSCRQPVGEFLVTHQDIADGQKNARLLKRYQTWFSEGAIPVVNEDDARSLEEIDIMLKGKRVFRDNDGLASLHAQFFKKAGLNPLLVLLSNTDGIYTAESVLNGRYDSIRVVKDFTGLEEQALPIGSGRGRGGVISKIEAARDATLKGIPVVVANGQYCNHDSVYQKGEAGAERKYCVLGAILAGKVAGTRFVSP